jgi:hypothetical protein
MFKLLREFAIKDFFPTSRLTEETKKIPNDKLRTRNPDFLRFVTQALRSSFKHLIMTSPTLLQGLHKMSMLKMVPDGLKPRECKRVKLREPTPVPYVLEKDEVQDKVAKMRSMEIKTTTEKNTTLMRKDFLMHVTAVLDTIKKRGHFKDYEKAVYAYDKARKAIESARAGLALLEERKELPKKLSKKKTKEAKKEAAAKAPDPKAPAKAPEQDPMQKEDKVTPAAKDDMIASFLSDLEKAKLAQRTAKGAMDVAAGQMFSFYSSLLFPKSKYSWNKSVSEQTESNPYVNLQGDTLEGPRGMPRKSFQECGMFHLLTAFPINAAEQEKYYISNVLKKPQRVNVRQFVRQVEQLNAYIAQMPCFYYSPHANASTKPENIPFMEAELGAHVLWMCPLPWQDQYNMNEKGMTPMDMHLLLTLLEAIECVCTHEKGKPDHEKSEKSSFKSKKGKKHPGTSPTVRVAKKVRFEKHCNLCKKYGGTHPTHNTGECRKYERDGTEKSSFCATKKGGKKKYPVTQNFAQLTEKIDKLEKALKKSGKKGKKHCYEDSDSNSE